MPRKSRREREAELWNEFAQKQGNGHIADRSAYLAAGRAFVERRLEAESYGAAAGQEAEEPRSTITAEKTPPFLSKIMEGRLGKTSRGRFEIS